MGCFEFASQEGKTGSQVLASASTDPDSAGDGDSASGNVASGETEDLSLADAGSDTYSEAEDSSALAT